MKSKALISLFVICASLTACADRKNLSPIPAVSEEAKSNMAAPVNCDTAEEDIAILEEEKASVAKRVFSGVRSVVPFAAAAGILLGDYRGRVEVATGKYNADLEAKIVEIRTSCGL